ncbi:MAG: LacI family DNA-binding transcriptional regulator [Spirochaetales bacterium]|nr:LacI family DNA-binding transcriptional regulator [Spirochaetales bacterium]
MPSIKDVARLAGVSYTTVSHAINKTRPVKEETVRKIEKVIKEIGYVPNMTARCLREGKTKTIGVIDANIYDMFFGEVMRSAQNELEAAGYSLYFSYSFMEDDHCGEDCFDFFAEKEISYLEKLIARDVDAIIINPINRDDVLADFFSKVQIPVILFQRDLPGQNTFPIMSDDYAGGYKAIEHLVSLGHKDLAVVYGFSYPTHSVVNRRTGAEKAASDGGIDPRSIQWRNGDYSMEGAYKQTVELLNSPHPPTGIFYYSDAMAMGGLRAAADLGVPVPADLSIVGYDDIPLTAYYIPRLTSVRQDSGVMGRYIAEKTVNLIEGVEMKNKAGTVLPVELTVRESSGPVKSVSP